MIQFATENKILKDAALKLYCKNQSWVFLFAFSSLVLKIADQMILLFLFKDCGETMLNCICARRSLTLTLSYLLRKILRDRDS